MATKKRKRYSLSEVLDVVQKLSDDEFFDEDDSDRESADLDDVEPDSEIEGDDNDGDDDDDMILQYDVSDASKSSVVCLG